jgi:hypothetical protein
LDLRQKFMVDFLNSASDAQRPSAKVVRLFDKVEASKNVWRVAA